MSKPLVTFGDPETAIRSYLDAAFTGSLAASKPDYVKADPPSLPLGDRSYVQVQLDGTPSSADYPATDRATVRINCCTGAGHRTDVKALASLVQGLVSVHPGDATVFGTYPLMGRSAVVSDPDTKNLMVWFLVRVNLRPTPVVV